MFELKHSSDIEIEDFPLQWITLVSCLDPELPGFPLHYVHFMIPIGASDLTDGSDLSPLEMSMIGAFELQMYKEPAFGTRVFGCPVQVSLAEITGLNICTARIKVISNIDLDSNLPAREKFKAEIQQRFGLSEKIGIEGLHACAHDDSWSEIIDLIFPRVEKYYGDYIPYGQFYSELFGIFRFAAAWNTTGGRKQEMIMLSNLLSRCGEEVVNETEFPSINFRLLPTYGEVLTAQFFKFPSFQCAYEAINEVGNAHLNAVIDLPGGTSLRTGEVTNPNSMGTWNNFMDRHDFSTPTVEFFTGVKEDMNRNNMRPFVFLTHMYSLFSGCDYSKWTKEDYLEVYHPEKKGTYPKVLACFLQQSFLKRDIMPVDAWMLAFFAELLLHDKANIPTLGSELGRLERFVWATVQLRKNNQPGFDDILFCIKTGVMHSKSIHNRQPNPLSCRLCKFEESCPTRRKVVTDKTALAISPQTKLSDEEVGAIQLETLAMKSAGEEIKIHGTGTYPRPDGQGPDFIILLKDDDTPFGVYLPTNKITKDKWKLIDNMSAMTIHDPFEPGKTYSY